MAAPRQGDGINRTVLLGLGTVLLAGAVAGLLIGGGAIGKQDQHKPVFDNFLAQYVGRHGQWVWPLIALAMVLTGLLALRWVGTQLHTERASEIDLPAERRGGRTLVAPAALSSVLNSEIEGYHGVRSATARWVGQSRDPSLRLQVTHARDTDIPGLLQRLETEALAHLRIALDRPDLPIVLDLKAR